LTVIGGEIKQVAFDVLWEHNLVGLALVESGGRFISANKTFCDLVGYNIAELQDRTYQSITHPDDVKYDAIMTSRIINGEETSFSMKKRYITKTGDVVWVLLRVNPVRRNDGTFVACISQVSELIDLIPPSIKYPLSTDIKNKRFWDMVKSNWSIIAFFIVAVAGIISYILKELG